MLLDIGIKKKIAQSLLNWYKKNGRKYPWRRNRDPYKILMAEIMLQRTRADQVLPAYLSFIKKFPTVKKLCNASREEIKKYFDHLGLIWRGELVKDLAEELLSRFNGKVPDKREELLSLPSIGEYIADAVLSFAYGKDIAVVDANVCRVIGRIFGLGPTGEARRDPRFREIAQQLIPPMKAKEFNWAMIDFASAVCTPRRPRCTECPLTCLCKYRDSKRI